MRKTIAAWLAVASCAAADLADKPHPRLWMPASAEASVRKKIADDPLAIKLQAAVLAEAEEILTSPTCRYDIPDGKRLLRESRLALNNIMHCAWAWRFTGEDKYRARTIAELDAACALKDWNPSHFLDVGEMATAVATGYDWLYPTLTKKQREVYERAIIDKALKPAKKIYDTSGWWSKARNNWSQVCGSGIAIAAAAVAGNDEGLSEDLFAKGLKLIENCEKFYEPDGMYPEGPGYWHYGTDYHIMLLGACGPLDEKFTATPLLKKGADAIMHLAGPTLLPFNFADAHAKTENPTPAQCWIASHFKDAAQIRHLRGLLNRAVSSAKKTSVRTTPLCILWLPKETTSTQPTPNAAVFHGEQSVALFRSGWTPDATWLGIKGGTPEASHGHMDVGSFCYDAHGIRWIHDLGGDNYNMPEYFGKKRFSYFRLQNRSHNTLEIGGNLQNEKSSPCPIIASETAGDTYLATFDLSEAYKNSASKVLRTARFHQATGITRIEDEITAPDGDVVWRAYTDAAITIKGDTAVLTKKSEKLTLRRVSKSGSWSVASATPPNSIENQNTGYKAIVLTVPKAASLSIDVEIRP